jgi:hypothetical protein
MRWHRSHTRKILDLRPRVKRAHRGAEFQLKSKHLDIIDRFAECVEASDRSAALRLYLDRTQDTQSRVMAAWHGLDEGQSRGKVMDDLAELAAWIGGNG